MVVNLWTHICLAKSCQPAFNKVIKKLVFFIIMVIMLLLSSANDIIYISSIYFPKKK